jgi:hypothetical protein
MRYQLPCKKGAKIQTTNWYKMSLIVVVVSTPKQPCKIFVIFRPRDFVVVFKIGNGLHFRGRVMLIKLLCYVDVA